MLNHSRAQASTTTTRAQLRSDSRHKMRVSDPSALARGRLIVCLLASAILLGMWLRVQRMDLLDVRFDQAYPLLYARDIAQGKFWGMQPHGSVAGHPAAYFYVMALPYLFSKHFLFVAYFRIMLDVVAIAMCGAIGLRYFGVRSAVLAAYFYAVAPWAIQFSRNLWPVCQPLFSAVLLVGLLELFVRRRARGFVLVGIGLALVPGVHLAGVYVLPVVALVLWQSRRLMSLRTVAALIAPGLVIAGLYLWQDGADGFANVRALLGTASRGATLRPEAFTYTIWLSGGASLGSLTGRAFPFWNNELQQQWGWIDSAQAAWFVTCLCVLTIMIVVRRGLRQQQARASTLLLLWICAPVVLQAFSSRPVESQYLPVVLPAPALICAVVLDALMRVPRHIVLRRLSAVLGYGAFALLLAWQTGTTLRFHALVDRHDTDGGYGQPVRSALGARQRVIEAAQTGDLDGPVIVAVKGFATQWDESTVVLRAVLADVPHRFVDVEREGAVFRQTSTHYVIAPGAERALDWLRGWTAGDLAVFSTPARIDGPVFVYARGGPFKRDGFSPAPLNEWENGIVLERVRAIRSGDELVLESQLRVLREATFDADYHWFAHVFIGPDKIGGNDIGGVHPTSWRPGDIALHVQRIPLESKLAPGPFRVRIGQYTYPEIRNIAVRQPDKAPDSGLDVYIEK